MRHDQPDRRFDLLGRGSQHGAIRSGGADRAMHHVVDTHETERSHGVPAGSGGGVHQPAERRSARPTAPGDTAPTAMHPPGCGHDTLEVMTSFKVRVRGVAADECPDDSVQAHSPAFEASAPDATQVPGVHDTPAM